MSHLHPMENSLWQRPLDKFNSNSKIWYYRAPLGEKKSRKHDGKIVSEISVK